MNELTGQILEVIRPEAALIAYRCDSKDSYEDKYYLEIRPIDRNRRMGEGRPVTEDFMIAIASDYLSHSDKRPYGTIPPNLLYADCRSGQEKYVWWNPPQKRNMFFSKDLNIADDCYNVPGVVYIANGDNLNIYAFKGNKPDEDQQLYRAPFFNVYENGNVCLGSAKVTQLINPTFEELMEYWEKIFWLSRFSHINGTNPVRSNLVIVTKAAHNAPFDENELIATKTTLKSLLR